ncbi:MAG: hypothetical protein ABEJ56_01115 [Candidatus Nanohaloarchaea archaeon]
MKYIILTALLSALLAGSLIYEVPEAEWQREVLDNETLGKFVEVDAYGAKVGVAYVESTEEGLVIEERKMSEIPFLSASGWERQVVDNKSGAGMYVSLESSGGKPYLAYQDGTIGEEKLKYAYRNGSKWEREVIEGVAGGGISVGMYSSLSFLNGKPVILYHSPSRGLKLAEKKESWSTRRLENGQGWFTSTSSCGDRILAAYRGRDTARMKLGKYSGEWSSENLSVNARSDVAMDAVDCEPHYLYLDRDSRQVTYRNGDREKQFFQAFFSRMSLDVEDQVHLLYHEPGTGVVYRRNNDSSWIRQVLKEGEDIGRFNDLEVSGGNVYAAYTGDEKVYYSVYNAGDVRERKAGLRTARIILSALFIISSGLSLYRRRRQLKEHLGKIRS